MSRRREPGWYDAVRRNWRKTIAFLLAGSHPCLEVRDDEIEAIEGKRVLVGLSFDDLEAWDPPESWMLAVLLCPDDTIDDLVDWADAHDIDPARVHFFLHPDTPWEVLRPWLDAGYPTDRVDDDIGTWERLHRLFGLALSERIVKDWGPS